MIKWRRATAAGLLGTVVFDLLELLMTGRLNTPAMLGTKLEIGLAGGVLTHYLHGVILAIVYAGVAPSLWGPNWVRALAYVFVQNLFVYWLFLDPLLGLGIAGLKAGVMTPVYSLIRHFGYGLVLAWMYPVRVAHVVTGASSRPVATADTPSTM